MFSPLDYDSRFHEKMDIIHSIDVPLENITVSEICRRNGITRNKFYYLFSTKEDMFYWFTKWHFTSTLNHIGRTLTWHEGVSSYLESFEEEQTFMLNSSTDLIRMPKIHRLPFESLREQAIIETIEVYKKRGITASLKLEIRTYVIAEECLSRTWMQPHEFESRDEYVRAWIDCVPRNLCETLELKR